MTAEAFDLDANPPSVTIGAAYVKNRQADTLPIRADAASALRTHLTGKPAGVTVFNMPAPNKPAEMLRTDLADAAITYRDDAGRVTDVHALPHTFITNLTRGGVHPKLAQALARHSTITRTMDRYSHTVIGEQADALAVLPDLSDGPERERVRATGTHDGRPPQYPQRNPPAVGTRNGVNRYDALR